MFLIGCATTPRIELAGLESGFPKSNAFCAASCTGCGAACVVLPFGLNEIPCFPGRARRSPALEGVERERVGARQQAEARDRGRLLLTQPLLVVLVLSLRGLLLGRVVPHRPLQRVSGSP